MKFSKLTILALLTILTACALSAYETKRHNLLNRYDLNPNADLNLDEALIAFSSTEDVYNRNLAERRLCEKGGGVADIDELDAHIECAQYAPADKGNKCSSHSDCQGICIPTSNTCSSNWSEIKNCADFLSRDGLTNSICFGADGIGGS